MARDQVLGEVRSRIAQRGREEICIDFKSRRVTPRRLYSYLGVPIRSRAEAEAYLTLIREQVARGRSLQDVLNEVGPEGGEGPGLEPLLKEWRDLFRRKVDLGDKSDNTLRDYNRWLTPGRYGYLTWWFGASLFTVDESSLDEWSLWMAEQGIGPKTRRNVMAAFHSFCVWARKRRKTWEMPAFPWPEEEEHIPTLISPELQERVLDAIPRERRGPFLAMARLLIRPNEARVVRAVAWRGDVLKIHRGQKDRRVAGREGGTKKHRGAKILPVPADLQQWLEEHVSAEQRLDQEALLFRNPRAKNDRGQWSETAMRRAWYAACDKAGVKVSLYEGTKHSTATALKGLGVDDRILAQAAGHADPRSIEKYAKLQTEVIRTAFEQLPRGGRVVVDDDRSSK